MSSETIVERYPLSPLQQGMLFHYLREPAAGVDIEQIVCSLPEEIQPNLLKQAWTRVVQRHAVLRTAFHWQDDAELEQVVHAQVEFPWQELDWRAVPDADQEERLNEFLTTDRHLGFDMSRAPLLRVLLIRMGEQHYRMVWIFHHALIDGRCFPILLNEVFGFYKALCTGGQLDLAEPKPYREYVEWLSHHDHAKAEKYWRNQLQGFTTPTPLAIDELITAEDNPTGCQGDDQLFVEEGATAALGALAEKNGITLNTLIQGAWALLLSRHSGEDEVMFGVVRACRKSSVPAAEDIIGLFINTLPLRVRISQDALLTDWLKELRAQWMSMRDFEHTPLVQVQKWSDIPAGMRMFESVLMFENYQLEARLRQQGGDWANRSVRLHEQTGYPITLTVYSGKQLCLQIEFDRRRFPSPTITRMLRHLKTLLEGMLAHPTQRLRDLPVLTTEEQRQLLVDWNDTRRDYPEGVLLHELFEAQVERTPNAIAVTFENQHFTYAELDDRANQLAHYLQKMGVGPDSLVGVCMERSLELVLALYGVLKAGAAYVPIDPAYPANRVEFMLRDANVPILLTQERLLSTLPAQHGKVLCLDRDWDQVAQEDARKLAISLGPNNLAYMIYTSGSTGQPKGAMNTHRGICNRLLWMQEQYRLTDCDKVLQKTPFSFDVSVWEFFWPLLFGARLVVAKPEGHRDPTYLTQLIQKERITVVHFVPSMLRLFLEEPRVSECKSLWHVICSGEALPIGLQQRFFELLPAQLHNLYGPTEAAVDVTHWTCRRDDTRPVVPIGRPVANTQVYVLDRYLRPVPIGVPGELFLGGVQVGRGYHNRPELTAERFVPDPFSQTPGARLYKTGDLCRWLPDGILEYLARLDFQIKIRGLRVELGEIEASIADSELVKSCAVVARDNGSGDKRIVAYIVWHAGVAPAPEMLRHELRRKLPDYMVPAHFVSLESLPLSPNGKLDQRALPSPIQNEMQENSKTYLAPHNDTEQRIAEIWQAILGTPKVGRTDNFFDLGGDSIRLIRVRNQLQHTFARELAIVDMFRYTTVATLAEHLTGQDKESVAQDQNLSQIDLRKGAARRQLQVRQETRVN